MFTVDGQMSRLATLQHLADRIVGTDPKSPFFAPGVAIIVARGAEVVAHVVSGVDARGAPVRRDSIFGLASVSKLVLGIALLRLVDDGCLRLDDPLARYVPDAAAARPGVTLRRLLSHTSGLPLEFRPGQVQYGPQLDWNVLARACRATPVDHEPGTSVQYSNVAYGLLGLVIECVSGSDYATAAEGLTIDPLGVDARIGRQGPRPQVAVMDVNSPFVGTDVEPFNSAFSQNLMVPWSSVNATADALLSMVRVYGGSRPDLVRPETAAEARSDQTDGLGGGFATSDAFMGFTDSKSIAWPRCAWGLTVELRGDKRPHWTPGAASPGSFGQIGSSGCLAWCDPTRDVSWAILGARTTDSGWMLRYAGGIGNAALALASEGA